MRARALRPDVFTYDAGEKWRGGQILSIVGATTTVKLLAEAHIVRTKTVATDVVPLDAQSVGCPVCCRVEGDGSEDYVIVEVRGSTFGTLDPPTNNAQSVAAGVFSPGIILRSITGAPVFWED